MTYEFDYVYLSTVLNNERNGGFILKWSAKNIGFGELTFLCEGRKTICETECMSREFIDQAVKFWLDNITFRDV